MSYIVDTVVLSNIVIVVVDKVVLSTILIFLFLSNKLELIYFLVSLIYDYLAKQYD